MGVRCLVPRQEMPLLRGGIDKKKGGSAKDV